jgi:hypothetical protein
MGEISPGESACPVISPVQKTGTTSTHGIESPAPRGNIDNVAKRNKILDDAGARIVVMEHHDTLRLWIWERAEQYRLDDREHGKCRAQTHAERSDRREREATVPPESDRAATRMSFLSIHRGCICLSSQVSA